MKCLHYYVAILLLAGSMLLAQDPQQSLESSETLRNQALNVFISGVRRYMTYIREEITFVNYMIDRTDADVYILVTSQLTGSGGREVIINFIGQKTYTGKNDTLKLFHLQNDTEAIQRERLGTGLKVGLMRYVALTPLFEQMRITYSGLSQRGEPEVVDDPWDSWVFRISANGNFRGEELENRYQFYGSFQANRIAEDWKTRARYYQNYEEENFTNINRDSETGAITDTTEWQNITRSLGASGLIVKTLGPFAGVGISARYVSDTYRNIKNSVRFAPALEYNLFPYSQSSRRELRVNWSTGLEAIQYIDSTIFDQIAENLLFSALEISLEFTERWGTLRAGIEYNTYIPNFAQNSIEVGLYLNFRVGQGLSLTIYGGFDQINNELNIIKQDLEEWQILLGTYQRETAFRYNASIGISYTFGSIYNNVVNTRFGGGRGRF